MQSEVNREGFIFTWQVLEYLCNLIVVTNSKVYILVMLMVYMDKTKRYGEAYAFFDCNAGLNEVSQQIDYIVSRFPEADQSKLELSLSRISNFRKKSNDTGLLQAIDSFPLYPNVNSEAKKLKEIAEPLKMTDLRYVLAAKYNPGTNADAAKALGDIMNGMYAGHGDEPRFACQIVGKNSKGDYGVWRDDIKRKRS